MIENVSSVPQEEVGKTLTEQASAEPQASLTEDEVDPLHLLRKGVGYPLSQNKPIEECTCTINPI